MSVLICQTRSACKESSAHHRLRCRVRLNESYTRRTWNRAREPSFGAASIRRPVWTSNTDDQVRDGPLPVVIGFDAV